MPHSEEIRRCILLFLGTLGAGLGHDEVFGYLSSSCCHFGYFGPFCWQFHGDIIIVIIMVTFGQAVVTYRFPSDHRSQAPSSGVSTWMGDHPGTPRAVGNTWCTRHVAKQRPQVGRVCWSHHQNTPQFTANKCDWSLDLSKKKKKKS